jgi:macrophage erythroblast attacher
MHPTEIFWQSKLEFTLRFQQYIELIRTQNEQKLLDAIAHAKKFMSPFEATYPKEVRRAAGLLAFPPGGRSSVYEVCEPFGTWS